MIQWLRLFARFSLLIYTALFTRTAWSATILEVTSPCQVQLPHFDFQLSGAYSETNAYLALWASMAVEIPNRELMALTLQTWGFREVKLIGRPLKGAQAYIAEAKDYRLIAVRGTTSALETMQDMRLAQSSLGGIGLPGKAHRGFVSLYQQVYRDLAETLKKRQLESPKPIVLVGHSMGGAVALLLAMKLEAEGFDIQSLYTSAQPRVGDEAFYRQVASTLEGRYFRLENPLDFVPHVPPSANAQSDFASTFFAEGTRSHASVSQLVERLAYGLPVGMKVVFGEDDLMPTFGGELEDEKRFWQSTKTDLTNGDGFDPLFALIDRQGMVHAPPAYICQFLRLRPTFRNFW
ncbi:MAG: lipase family protein [Proteobacteria bacterium]|nr:MAG: lipase family protein [Pseudomonadota bacterium]